MIRAIQTSVFALVLVHGMSKKGNKFKKVHGARPVRVHFFKGYIDNVLVDVGQHDLKVQGQGESGAARVSGGHVDDEGTGQLLEIQISTGNAELAFRRHNKATISIISQSVCVGLVLFRIGGCECANEGADGGVLRDSVGGDGNEGGGQQQGAEVGGCKGPRVRAGPLHEQHRVMHGAGQHEHHEAHRADGAGRELLRHRGHRARRSRVRLRAAPLGVSVSVSVSPLRLPSPSN